MWYSFADSFFLLTSFPSGCCTLLSYALHQQHPEGLINCFIIFFSNDIMTDLTLYEYQGFSEEELGRILQAEANNMLNSHCHESDFRENSSYFDTPQKHKHRVTHFISPYWVRFTDVIVSNIPKILSNLARSSS